MKTFFEEPTMKPILIKDTDILTRSDDEEFGDVPAGPGEGTGH